MWIASKSPNQKIHPVIEYLIDNPEKDNFTILFSISRRKYLDDLVKEQRGQQLSSSGRYDHWWNQF
jgi:hypothetical protein